MADFVVSGARFPLSCDQDSGLFAYEQMIATCVFLIGVFLLNSDGMTLEVHSVPLLDDAYVYARSLVERDRRESKPDRRYEIEQRGAKSAHSADEVIALASRAKTR